ncbi:MAG: hypothetical protein HQL68_02985 [Magnetococcales bacterium]|nr:hypothetical protein [Magnetococcales bacterium]
MEYAEATRPRLALISAVIAVMFGLLTIKSGGAVLFIDGEARLAAGNYSPFVLWFNFLAGFAYIIAGVGIYFWRVWAIYLAIIIALATMLVFAIFGITIYFGASYEVRTIGALSLRSVVWIIIGLTTFKAWKK